MFNVNRNYTHTYTHTSLIFQREVPYNHIVFFSTEQFQWASIKKVTLSLKAVLPPPFYWPKCPGEGVFTHIFLR